MTENVGAAAVKRDTTLMDSHVNESNNFVIGS